MKVSKKKLLKQIERLQKENEELKYKNLKNEKSIYEFVFNGNVTEYAFVTGIGYKVWLDCERIIWFGESIKDEKEDESK